MADDQKARGKVPDSQHSQPQWNHEANYQPPHADQKLSDNYGESVITPATATTAMFSSFSTLSPFDPPSTVNTSAPGRSFSHAKNAIKIESDSDKDCIMVEPSHASENTKRRWTAPREGFMEHSRDAELQTKKEQSVKRELSPEIPLHLSAPMMPPSMNEVLAAQKEMFRRRKQGIASIHQPGQTLVQGRTFTSIFGPKETDTPASSGPSRPEPAKGIVRPSKNHGDQVVEDNIWMNEDLEQDDEYDSLKQLRTTLEKKRAQGTPSAEEDIELLQIRERLELIEKLRQRARDAYGEPEESMFIPEEQDLDAGSILTAHRQNVPWKRDDGSGEGECIDLVSPSGMDEGDEYLARLLQQNNLGGSGVDKGSSGSKEKGKKPWKPRKKAAKNAREFVEQQEDARREKERTKLRKAKVKKPSNRTAAGRGRGKPKGSGNSGKAKKGKGTTKSRGHGEHLMREENADNFRTLLADLLHNDAINDRLRGGYDPEPDIAGSSNKETQLRQIIASVPKSLDLRQRSRDKQDILNASRSFGYAKIKPVKGKWLPKGMKSSLFHHQLLGARFMLERELSKRAPHGGINADAMGLGKTVQMLATMVGNPPTAEDKQANVKTTLVVVPSAVISQWQEEIRKHVNTSVFPRVLHFKASKNIPLITIQDQDIVITSYAEVMNSYPYPDREGTKKLGQGGLEKWLREADAFKGDLHKIHWYRVVLDEAHAIKNYKGRTSLACQNLIAVYRWCLTGTPILNRVEELYPYLRFLRIPYTNSYAEFVQWFCDPDAIDCQQRITALLSFSMIRRSMNTKLLGRSIISLKDPHPEIQYIDFSNEERIIYRITENRFRQIINMHFADGDEQRSYGNFMVQLLRLRQCISHPFMIEQTVKECWNAEDLAELKRRLKRIRNEGRQKVYNQCKLWIDEATAKPGNVDLDDGGSFQFGRGDYGHEFKMQRYLKGSVDFDEQVFMDRVVCNLCSDVPQEPQITDCSHIFCKDCLTGYMHQKAAEDDHFTECPSCQLIFTSAKPYTDANLQFPDDDAMDGRAGSSQDRDGASDNGSQSYRRPHQKGRDALGFQPTTKPSRWLLQSDADIAPLLPSAKTTALKAKLLKWFHEAPHDKVVVFTQFRLLAKIVGRIAEQEKWEYLYYTGDASDQHRTKVVSMFHSDQKIKLLIAGLKCGGQGLNLTIANRCVSLDLWWNHAVEQQAFGRTFRIGQPKETYFSRICVRNTVEMRMLAMQADKLRIIDRMMQEGHEETRLPKLDITELASLFGYLDRGSDGKFFVRPDYTPAEGDADDGDEDGADADADVRGRA